MKKITKKQEQNQQEPVTTASPPMIADNTVVPLTIVWSEVAPEYQKSVAKYAKKVKVDGFRKGHVPATIAEKYLKPDIVIEETARQLLPDRVPNALKNAKVTPISQPEVQIKSAEKGSDWELELIVAEKPAITVKNYQSIVKKARKEADTAWKKQLAEEAKQEKTNDKTDTEAKKTQKSPEDQAKREKDVILQTIYAALVTELKPQIPELLIRQQVREELENLVRQLQGMKMTLDDFLAKSHQSFEELSGNMASRVLGQLQLAFILQAIATEAKLTVTDTEIDAEIARQVDPEHLAANQQNPRVRSYIQENVMQAKVIELLFNTK